MLKQYFKRPHLSQYWCKKANGEILLINYREPGKKYNYHYNGDSHIYLTEKDTFNQEHATEITREEWLQIRNQHLSRFKAF